MKHLFLIFMIGLFVSPSFAQEAPVDTTKVTITRADLDELFLNVDRMQAQNMEYRSLIANFERQLLSFKFIAEQDSILSQYNIRRIALLETEIELHKRQVKYLNRTKWKNYIWFGAGAGTLFIASILVNNVEN